MKRTRRQTYNRLTVFGNRECLADFVGTIMNEDGSIEILDSTIPIPGPSSAQVEQWGAFYGDYGQSIIHMSETEITIEFWSYYDPLIKGLTSVSMLFPDLTFVGTYYTTLKLTMGCYEVKHGQCVFEEINPENSHQMDDFCGKWDEKTENGWFALAESFFLEKSKELNPI